MGDVYPRTLRSLYTCDILWRTTQSKSEFIYAYIIYLNYGLIVLIDIMLNNEHVTCDIKLQFKQFGNIVFIIDTCIFENNRIIMPHSSVCCIISLRM
jgi:hypothetical protein